MDHVDKIIAQWRRERPELPVEPMALLGRLKRLHDYLTRAIEKTLAEHGLNIASFDVLATLRRSGPPYALSPGDLLATMMVTSGTMTNRIDQLSKSGLVERIKNPEDGRSVIISLTKQGREITDRTLDDYVKTQRRLVSGLTKDENHELNDLLRKFLTDFEQKK